VRALRSAVKSQRDISYAFRRERHGSAVVICRDQGCGRQVRCHCHPTGSVSVRSGDDLPNCCKVSSPFRPQGQGRRFRHCPLKCSSGRFGSCSGSDQGRGDGSNSRLPSAASALSRLRPKVSKKHSAVRRIKMADRAAELFNPDGKHRNWSKAQPEQ